jgi:ferritin-like metal-binding protein YciE
MKFNNLQDLFMEQLRDMYDAEQRLVKALPKMAKAAACDQLRSGFEQHLEQTKNHVTRLEQVFEQMGEKAKTETCPAMKGLIEEGDEIMSAGGDDETRDAGLIAAAQKVEHYEIASYGTLCTWAQQLGKHSAFDLLHQTLEEEKATDEKLTQIAESKVNVHAAHSA